MSCNTPLSATLGFVHYIGIGDGRAEGIPPNSFLGTRVFLEKEEDGEEDDPISRKIACKKLNNNLNHILSLLTCSSHAHHIRYGASYSGFIFVLSRS